MPHVTRPKIDPRFPVQITIRATRGLPSLRSPRVFGALRRAITRASLDRFRIIHFSIQQARPRVDRPAELRAAFLRMDDGSGGHGCRAGHSAPQHLDGAGRLAARRRAVARRRTPGRDPASARLEIGGCWVGPSERSESGGPTQPGESVRTH
jgi:hypothetical protein